MEELKLVVEYDKHQKLWCSYLKDNNSDVVSSYEYSQTKKSAEEWGKYMLEHSNEFAF